MKNATTAKQMRQHFDSIRDAIADMQKNTLRKISRLADDGVKARAKYNKDYFEQYKAEANRRTENEIAELKTRTLERVRGEFVQINGLLDTWVLSPVPDTIGTVLRSYKDFGIQPTRTELSLLSESANGSYLATKIISHMAKSIGLVDDFIPLEQLRRNLTAAESDTTTAIKNFIGLPDETTHKCTSDMLGLNLAPDRNWIVYAADFLQADNSFSRVEKNLCDVTASEFSLAPAQRRRIDQIFENVPDAERAATAARLIESDDNMSDLMAAYDKNLFLSALDLNAQEKRAYAEKLLKDAAQNDRNADKAARQAVQAQTRATAERAKAKS